MDFTLPPWSGHCIPEACLLATASSGCEACCCCCAASCCAASCLQVGLLHLQAADVAPNDAATLLQCTLCWQVVEAEQRVALSYLILSEHT